MTSDGRQAMFSYDSKIAVRKALLRGLAPLGATNGSGMPNIYNTIMKMAGADKQGELLGYLAREIYGTFLNNGNNGLPL